MSLAINTSKKLTVLEPHGLLKSAIKGVNHKTGKVVYDKNKVLQTLVDIECKNLLMSVYKDIDLCEDDSVFDDECLAASVDQFLEYIKDMSEVDIPSDPESVYITEGSKNSVTVEVHIKSKSGKIVRVVCFPSELLEIFSPSQVEELEEAIYSEIDWYSQMPMNEALVEITR